MKIVIGFVLVISLIAYAQLYFLHGDECPRMAIATTNQPAFGFAGGQCR